MSKQEQFYLELTVRNFMVEQPQRLKLNMAAVMDFSTYTYYLKDHVCSGYDLVVVVAPWVGAEELVPQETSIFRR